jgi:uncharacterized protein
MMSNAAITERSSAVNVETASTAVTGVPPFVEALLRPEAYPHEATDLRLHETHISWVILAGPYAYKIKKPVNFGFLDFSTREKRAGACVEEVRLNRRLSPDVYLGVTDVVERDGSYAIGAVGEPVEPAVWMRRLPEEGMLTHLLDTGEADARLVRRIARKLAQFHAVAATGPGVDEHGSLTTLQANWNENFAQTAPYAGRHLPARTRHTIGEFVERFLASERALLERRVATGRIRDGHGDLHAASICVEGRRVTLFDCIEFSARFRCADVAAEVAFLAMDLDHHGRADLAHAFVKAYVRESGDAELLTLLPFYKCYRAYVRGKVLSFRLDEPSITAQEAARIMDRARAYFDLAEAYANPGPVLVATMGLPASGKSTLAHALASRLGLVHLSSDVVRKEIAGLRPVEHQKEEFAQGLYRPEMTRRTYATLRRRAARWLRAGVSVVVDATFGTAEERSRLQRLAAHCGVPLVVLVCRAPEAVLKARLFARSAPPHPVTGWQAASDARLEVFPAVRAAFDQQMEMPGAAKVATVDSTQPPSRMIEHALSVVRATAPAAAG